MYYPGYGSWRPIATGVNDGQWHHVAIVLDVVADTTTVYWDGAPNVITGVTKEIGANDRFSLGQEWDGNTPSNFFNGSIDEVRIYDRVLSAEQIEALATPPGP